MIGTMADRRRMLAAFAAAALALALAAAAHGAEPAPGAQGNATTSANSVELPLEQQVERAMTAYADAAIEAFATSTSARERWIGGMMLADKALRSGASDEDAAALNARAQSLFDSARADAGKDPTLLFWVMFDPPVRGQSDSQAMAQARLQVLAQLQQLEPDNAVVWLANLPARDLPGSIPIAIEMLARAAAAKRFDTHFAATMRALLSAFGRVPLPIGWPDTRQLKGWEQVEATDVQVIMAVGVSSAMAMPYLVGIQWWCDGNSAEHPWLPDCRKLVQTMTERSDSIVPHSLALALAGKLHGADSAEAARARVQRRELAWLIENGMQRVGPGQPVTFSEWRKAWMKPGASELSVSRAMLAAQGLPATPPDDFVPAWDR
jgi:hypothetical protein